MRARPRRRAQWRHQIGPFGEPLLQLLRDRQDWAAPVILALAFGESLAFVSLLLPATALLAAIGGLLGAAGIPFWPNWAAAALGAALGDAVSYWLGRHYRDAATRLWPLSRHPDLVARGVAFFRRWGAAGVFLGRFFGPLRSIVPFAAGICAMPALAFQAANAASALLWAAAVLAPGTVLARLVLS